MTENNIRGTSTIDLIRKMMTGDDRKTFIASFLKGKVFLAAIDSLIKARKAASLTQAEVAHALGTKQPAIARLEQDTAGSMSLKRLYDYAAACNAIPLITLAPESQVAEFAYQHPDEPLTADNYINWKLSKEQPADIWMRYVSQGISDETQTLLLGCQSFLDPRVKAVDLFRHANSLAMNRQVEGGSESLCHRTQSIRFLFRDTNGASTLAPASPAMSDLPTSPARQPALSY